MSTAPAPTVRPMLTLEVLRTDRLSPHMIRVVLGGENFESFTDNGHTDHYVKLVMPRPGVDYPEPFTPEAVQEALPREQWPVFRTYTVRRYDPDARELWIDFVHHGDEGFAGPWAASARPGDLLRFRGPGGAYSPDAEAPWHLLAGDESALPAIANALEAMPAGASVHALIEIDGPDDELDLSSPADLNLTWLHRSAGDPGFDAAVAALEFRAGAPCVFAHGELSQIRALKTHLTGARGLDGGTMSISGYWRRGKDEDGFQAEKRSNP